MKQRRFIFSDVHHGMNRRVGGRGGHPKGLRSLLLFLLACAWIAHSPAWAGADAGASGIWLDQKSVSLQKLPVGGGIPDLLERLGYADSEATHAFVSDLNGDGRDEFLVISAPVLCGTGGCPFGLVDGKTLRLIGEFFGSPLLVDDRKISGFPVMHAYSHASAGSGTFTTWVYDGERYQAVSSIFLAGDSIDELFNSFSTYRKVLAPGAGIKGTEGDDN